MLVGKGMVTICLPIPLLHPHHNAPFYANEASTNLNVEGLFRVDLICEFDRCVFNSRTFGHLIVLSLSF